MSHMIAERSKAASPHDRILASAARTLSTDPAATLAKTAAEAGVSRATLHRAFPSREAVVLKAGRAAMRSLVAALEGADLASGDAAEALDRLLGVLAPFGASLHLLLVVPELGADPEIARLDRASDDLVIPVVERCVKEGCLRGDVPLAWVLRALEGLLFALWTALANGEIAPNDAARLLTDTVKRGLG